jgi:hypothetical protein
VQLVFLDEKKYRSDGITNRAMQYGYSPSGQRLPIRCVFSAAVGTACRSRVRL